MKRFIANILGCLALLVSTAFADSITAKSQWELWTTGNDANGGCFDPSIAGGTDRSGATTAFVVFNGTTVTASNGGASATITLAGYTVVAGDVGNCLHITGGTNFTAGWYTITSVNTGANTWTLNGNVTTAAGSGMTGNMGGALATWGVANSHVAAGNTVWVKATAVYTTTASITGTAGTAANPITWIGYTSTHTDGGPATLQQSTTSSLTTFITGNYNRMYHLVFDANSLTGSNGLQSNGSGDYFEDIEVKNFKNNGFASAHGKRIYIHNGGTAGSCNVGATMTTALLTGFVISNNTCTGISGAGGNLEDGLVYSNTGASSDGIQLSSSTGGSIKNVVVYANGRDGIRCVAGLDCGSVPIINVIAEGNAGYGINSATTDWSATGQVGGGFVPIDYIATYNNTLGAYHFLPTPAHNFALSGTAFVNAAGGNFSLGTNAASLQGAGFPQSFLGAAATISYLDIGAAQSQCTASGGTVVGACAQ